MKFEQSQSDLKNKIYYPVYFLAGEESYYIDVLSDIIEKNVLSESERDFNQTIVYGRDTSPLDIVSLAKRYPMMANHQVVIVKEAQDVQKIEDLEAYMANPMESTVLVLNYKYKKVDKRKSFFKKIEKSGVLFESKKIYDNQIPAWINNYVQNSGYSITPKATFMLAEFLGSDLGKIVNEINKLILNIPGKTEINDDQIEKNIGISKDFNIFELQNAIGSRDIIKANRIAIYFAANPKENPLVKTITVLFGFFSKLLIYHQLKDKSKNNVASALSIHSYFVKDFQVAARKYNMGKLTFIIGLLREYDLKSKGVNNISTTDGELLKEFLFKILH
jgi:DNA polymerase-3 subunit delta